MKKFRKNKNGFYVCEICGKEYLTFNGFSQHVGKIHNKEDYYNEWINDEGEKNCKICGNKTKFSNKFNIGYKDFCSNKCASKSTRLGFEKCMIKKYGTIVPMQNKKSRKKYEDTMIKRYGVSVPSKNKVIIEIKSAYMITFDPDLKEKRLAVIKNGYNYLLIVDKNYEQFEKLLKNE